MSDKGTRDVELWSPVSLLYELRSLLGQPPRSEEGEESSRRSMVHRIIEILDERGIAFEEVLRDSFARAQGVLLGVAAALEPDLGSGEPEQYNEYGIVVERWRSLLGLEDSGSNDIDVLDRARVILEIVPRTVTWAMSASIDELLDWWPADGGAPVADHDAMTRLAEGNRWITDRFLATYLDHWAPSSLHAEWEWIHGNRESPIPLAAMRARKIDSDRLAAQIADVAVTERVGRSSALAMAQYQTLAVSLLDQGRYEAAAGVFEGVIAVEPHDPDAHNNRGFCLLPVDAEAAVASLEEASKLGYEPMIVNTANRVVALLELDRLAAAHDLAERGFAEALTVESGDANLWDPSTLRTDPTLVRVSDMAGYFADVGVELARRVGDALLEDVWTARRHEREVAAS